MFIVERFSGDSSMIGGDEEVATEEPQNQVRRGGNKATF
jgi:hypothetical protein